MIKTKFFPILVVFLSLILLVSPSVNAIGISVTKAVIEYKDVLQGGYAEDSLYVSTDAPFDVPISYELLGDIKDWINVSPDLNNPNNTITVNNSKYQQVRIIVNPPADIPLGQYTGTVRIITGTLNNGGQQQYGSQLQAAFMIRLTVTVVGTQFISCNGGGIALSDSEIGSPIEYYMTVSNSGNVRITPTATIDIWNQDQTKLIDTKQLSFNSKEILPTTNFALSNSIANDLRIGQYWAYITVHPCENSVLTTFNVYEKGSIVDSGEFLRLDNVAWASIGDVVPITAIFKNTGSRTVSAKFKGIVTLNNKIVDTLDSEYYDIVPGQTSEIPVYYTPKKFGQYVISGRILYNNKLSYEKSSVINVNTGVEKANFNWVYILVIIIIIIVILLLLIRIRRKKHEIGHGGNNFNHTGGHNFNHNNRF